MRTRRGLPRLVSRHWDVSDGESTSSITNGDKAHQTVTVTVRFMAGVLCRRGRRQRCVPARARASARPLGTTSTRNGSCSERGSGTNRFNKAA